MTIYDRFFKTLPTDGSFKRIDPSQVEIAETLTMTGRIERAWFSRFVYRRVVAEFVSKRGAK